MISWVKEMVQLFIEIFVRNSVVSYFKRTFPGYCRSIINSGESTMAATAAGATG
jgi:hypothetical protein